MNVDNQNAAILKIILLFVALFIVFLFNPVSVILLAIIMTFSFEDVSSRKNSIIFLIGISICFLAQINSTKIAENDLIRYITSFKESGHFDFVSYINNLKKPSECAYGIYEWVVNNFISSSESFFKFLTTVIEYFFLVKAIWRFGKRTDCNKNILLLSLLITIFNPYFFSLSMHLIRQSLAVSIFLYVMVERCLYGKTNWLLLVMCLLIHNVTSFLIILLFLPFLNNPIRKNFYLYLFVFLSLIFIKIIAGSLLNLAFISDSTASYVLERASNEKSFDLGEATPLSIALAGCIFLCSFYCSQISTDHSIDKISKGIRHMFSISLFVSFFVLLNVNMSELFHRFLMLLYPFIGLIFMRLFYKVKVSNATSILVSIGLFCLFLYLTANGTWTYENLNDYLFSGISVCV